jgi:hypothetical protein
VRSALAAGRGRVSLVAVPGGEEVAGDLEAVAAELFLFGHALAVGGEVPREVRPAELSLRGVEVVVAAPAVGADDPGEALAEQHPGLAGVAAGRDPEDRGLAAQRAPQRPAAACGLPAGLVDVDDQRCFYLLLEPGVRGGERLTGALDDRLDRPGCQLDPEQPRASSVVSRRETRFRTASVTTAACSLGPNAERDTPAGSSALVWAAQAGQHTRCSRCSLTRTAIGGSSATWWRDGSAASTRSLSAKRCAHERQRSGQCSTTSSTCTGGSSRRCLPSCPSWPPGLRPLPGPFGRAGAEGGSWEGGSEELRELRLRRCSSSATRASSRRFASTSSPIFINRATAVSRSPSRIASASARSTAVAFAEPRQVPSYLKTIKRFFFDVARDGEIVNPRGYETGTFWD